MSNFESYEIKSVPLGIRQISITEDPHEDFGSLESQSVSNLGTFRADGINVDENLNIGVDASDGDEDSLNFELYGDGISRDRIIRQLNGVVDTNFGDFLLENYKYWSIDDLSISLGELLKGLDVELINLVNSNYLHYINLDKSIDGSLDLTHDIKIDLNSYLKVLKNENQSIEEDTEYIEELKSEKKQLLLLKFTCERVIRLNELIECFDGLVNKFDLSKENVINEDGSTHGSRTHMILEMSALYFAITRIFINLKSFSDNEMVTNLGRKMNGLKLEFGGVLERYVKELNEKVKHCNLEEIDELKVELFEVFKVYQLLNSGKEFQVSIRSQ